MQDAMSPSAVSTVREPPIDAFKGAMRRFASGVGVITAGQGDNRRGLTATAISSVTMDPPTILVCVNKNGEAHRAIEQDGAFCVNILASDGEGAALDFAGQTGRAGAERFIPFSWSTLTTGAPALDGALANIDCEITERVETTSHTVFFGRVLDVRLSDGAPLVHFDRKFIKLEN